jgi:hypothetical protein
MSKESFVNEQYKLYQAKNKLYGDSFVKSIEKFGNVAVYVRLSDKVERIKQLLSKQDFTKELKIVNDEKIEDTVRDMYNYVCMNISYHTKADMREIMLDVINSPKIIFTYLCLPCGDFNNSVLSALNPQDIKLFKEIEEILQILTSSIE